MDPNNSNNMNYYNNYQVPHGISGGLNSNSNSELNKMEGNPHLMPGQIQINPNYQNYQNYYPNNIPNLYQNLNTSSNLNFNKNIHNPNNQIGFHKNMHNLPNNYNNINNPINTSLNTLSSLNSMNVLNNMHNAHSQLNNINLLLSDKPWTRAAKDPSLIQRGTELFVGNLALETVEDDLYEEFMECGDIIDVNYFTKFYLILF